MEKLEKFTSNKVAKEITNDTHFKKKCVEVLFFLIDDFEFDKIETENFGKGSVVTFKKRKNKYPSIAVEYEMGTLPNLSIALNSEVTSYLYEEVFLKAYPAHYEIQQIVQGDIESIDEYVKNLESVWERRLDEVSDEINKSLNSLAIKAKAFLKGNLENS